MDTLLTHMYRAATTRNKERFEMILEPMQAIVQLALVSYLPIGTKLHIQQNILYHQNRNWHQSFVRMYNNDQREDIYFLFNAITRFSVFYQSLRESDDAVMRGLFDLLVEQSRNGIDSLILTYQSANDHTLTNMLQLYKTILTNPSKYNDESVIEEADECLKHIDQIFVNINQIYSSDELCMMYYALRILGKASASEVEDHVRGIDRLLQPKNRAIQKWISEHIVY